MWLLLTSLAFLSAAISPSIAQLNPVPTLNYSMYGKTPGILRVAFLFTTNDLPSASLCNVVTFYNRIAANSVTNNKTCHNTIVPFYYTISTPFGASDMANLMVQIQAFNASMIVGSNNFLVNDIAAALGIPNFQIYQLPMANLAMQGAYDVLTTTINWLADNSYYQFANTIYYYIDVGTDLNAAYKAGNPTYGQNDVSYTTYHNSPEQQSDIQTAILQTNSLPFYGNILLMYDISLDFSLASMMLNLFSARYKTDRRYNLRMIDITFLDDNLAETVSILNSTLNSTSIDTLFLVYTDTMTVANILSVVNTNSASFISTSTASPQINWTFFNVSLLNNVNITIDALIFHWEMLQDSYKTVIAEGHCTPTSSPYTLWNCLLDYDFAAWLFQASQADCSAELTVVNASTTVLNNFLQSAFKNTTMYGSSGLMTFDPTGVRTSITTSFHLGVETYDQTIITCNFTNINNSVTPTCTNIKMPSVQRSVNGFRQVTVVTYNLPPFYYEENGVQRGINVDMVKAISSLLNLTYTIVPVDTIGQQDPTTLKWNGLIALLVNQQADFAVAALPVTSTYQGVVQYSSIYMEEQWSLLMARPDMVTFLQGAIRIFVPFDLNMWITAVGAIMATTAVLTLLDYLIPNSIKFDASRSFYFTTGRAIQGMAGASPDTGPSRLLIIFWSFVCLIIMQTYVSNMAALLLYTQRVKTSISSPYTILPNNYVPAAMYNSPSAIYYATTNVYQDHLLWTSGMSSNLITNSSQILPKVTNGQYVYIGQLDTNNFLAQRNPCYESIGSFGGEAYALATPIGVNQVTIQDLDSALQTLTTSGTLQNIIANYTQIISTAAPSTCNADVQWLLLFGETETTILDTVKMSGLFLVMALGCAVAIVMAIGEKIGDWLAKRRLAAHEANKAKPVKKPKEDDGGIFA